MLTRDKIMRLKQNSSITTEEIRKSTAQIISKEQAIEQCYKFLVNYQKDMIKNSDEDNVHREATKGHIRTFVDRHSPQVEGFIDEGVMDYKKLKEFLITHITLYGKINKPYYDKAVEEIQIQDGYIWIIDKQGYRLFEDENGNVVRYDSPEECDILISKLLSPTGKRLSMDNRIDNASSLEKYRVTVNHSMLHTTEKISGKRWPSIVIRKFPEYSFTHEQMLNFKTIPQEGLELLSIIALSRMTAVLAGTTGSGKTTVLNMLLDFVKDRTSVIEDPGEMKVRKYDNNKVIKNNLVSFEADNSSEGKSKGTTVELVEQALRMSFKGLVMSESRKNEEIAQFIQSTNMGFFAYTTAHTNSLERTLQRLATAYLAAQSNITWELALMSVIDSVRWGIQCQKFRDNSRVVKSIAQFTDVSSKNGILMPNIRPIIQYKVEGFDYDKSGRKIQIGQHYIVNSITEEIVEQLKENLIDESLYHKFLNIKEPIPCNYIYNEDSIREYMEG